MGQSWYRIPWIPILSLLLQSQLAFLLTHKLICTKTGFHEVFVFEVSFSCCHKLSKTMRHILENRPKVKTVQWHIQTNNLDLMDLILWKTSWGIPIDNKPSTD